MEVNHGDWLEKSKANLMISATVIAGMTFQIMANIPGGTWDEDDKCSLNQNDHQTNAYVQTCLNRAGTSKLQYNEEKRYKYIALMVTSVISFSSSMNVILLVISGIRLRNRVVIRVLVMLMVIAVLSTTLAFYIVVMLVHSEEDGVLYVIVGFGLLSHCLIVVYQIIELIVWVIRFLCCGRPQPSTTQHVPVIPSTQPLSDDPED